MAPGDVVTYGLRPLLTQLNNGTLTASNDCGPTGILNATRTVSRGKVGPTAATYLDDWIRFVRNMAREYTDGFMFRGDTLQVLQHPDYERSFTRVGLRPPRVQFGDGNDTGPVSWDYMRHMLRSGWVVLLPVDYGVLRRGKAPMGSLSFSGDHLVVLVNPWENSRGYLYARMGDSLMDGRIRYIDGQMHQYPKGWRNVRVWDYKEAAAAWGTPRAGEGKTYAIFVRERT